MIFAEGKKLAISPAVSMPTAPPPAIRTVLAVGRLVCRALKAAGVRAGSGWKVQRGEADVVPVAMKRES